MTLSTRGDLDPSYAATEVSIYRTEVRNLSEEGGFFAKLRKRTPDDVKVISSPPANPVSSHPMSMPGIAAIPIPKTGQSVHDEEVIRNRLETNKQMLKTDWCAVTRQKYQVIPMKSWGKLPPDMQTEWKEHNCDSFFAMKRMEHRPISRCPPEHLDDSTKYPLIAIMAASTTRKVTAPSTLSIALFKFLLPSLARTLDCGYQYVYVLGYDVGDPYYDSKHGIEEVKVWFEDNIAAPLRNNNIHIKLLLVRVNNTLKKPGPVFIEMARAAFNEGAEYFYRVNDDTELLSAWPHAYVTALRSLPAPYGIVGPACAEGNNRILTHDFAHRTHMEIFEMNYYPPELVDWWMDDWISLVYGKQRTFMSRKISVIHHTGAHGQRYTVDQENKKHLFRLVISGRQKIREWMLKHGTPESELAAFDKDVYQAGFVHSDLPPIK